MDDDTVLDVLGPFRGPCGLCGGPDQRHRVADAIVDRCKALEDEESVAADYGLDVAAVLHLCEHWHTPAAWMTDED